MILLALAILSLSAGTAQSKSLKENAQEKLINDNKREKSAKCQFEGFYCDTCYRCFVYDTTLECSCKDDWGGSAVSTIEPAECNGPIINNNGLLEC